MDFLQYWKEVLGLLSVFVTVMSLVSDKFRETISFWKKRKHEEKKDTIELKEKDLSFTQMYQKYQEDKLKDLLKQLEDQSNDFESKLKAKTTHFEKELSQLQGLLDKSDTLIEEYKSLLGKYRAHIRYLQNLLVNNKIEFYRLEDNGSDK